MRFALATRTETRDGGGAGTAPHAGPVALLFGVAPPPIPRTLRSEERDWTAGLFDEPEYPGVYALASVNGHRPPYFWRCRDQHADTMQEWLLAGRAYVRADRTWVVRLSSGCTPGSPGGHVTLLQGTWAPATTGRLAVRSSHGVAGAWLANGRSLIMPGLVEAPDRRDDVVEVTLRFRKWR